MSELLFTDTQEIGRADQDIANEFARELSSMLKREMQAPRELSGREFPRLYDPSLPTVAIDILHSFSGSELLGVAAAKRCGEEKSRMNIVYVSTFSAGYEITEDGLTVKRGFFVDERGGVAHGELPSPIRVDVVESVDTELLRLMRGAGIPTLSDPDLMDQINDKTRLAELGALVGICVPKRYLIDELTEDNDIVIKPSRESQGRGVFFSSRYPRNLEQWRKYYTLLDEHGYQPIIEERIRPWPMYDPESDEQLDWNVRALVAMGQPIDMYIRAAPMETPVNKSTGARTIPITELGNYIQGDEIAATITCALREAAEKYALKMPEFLSGIDLTVDKFGEVVMFESNAGHVGGLQTIARMVRSDNGDPLGNADRLLELMIQKISSLSYPTTISNGMVVGPTDEAKIDFLQRSRNLGGQFLVDEGDFANASRFATLAALVSNLNYGHFDRFSDETNNDNPALARLIEEYPLELPLYMARILGIAALRDGVGSWLEADPLNRGWNMVKGKIAAEEGNLTEVRRIYAHLYQEGHLADAGTLAALATSSIIEEVNRTYGKPTDDPHTLRFTIHNLISTACMSGKIEQSGASEVPANPEIGESEELGYFRAGVALTSISLNHYSAADEQLHALRAMEDDEADDFIISTLNDKAVRMLATPEGAALLVKYAEYYELTAVVLDSLLNARTTAPLLGAEVTIEGISRIYAPEESSYTEDDRCYFVSVLKSITTGEEADLEPPVANDSALRLLTKLYALPRADENRKLARAIAQAIRSQDERFRSDVDLLLDF